MIHSVDVSQPLCHPPLSLPNGLKNKVARVAEVKTEHRLSNVAFHLPKLIHLLSLLSAQLVQGRYQQLIPDMLLSLQRESASTWWHIYYIASLPL